MDGNELLRKLDEYGADCEGIEQRFLNDMAFYEDCLHMFLQDNKIVPLGIAIEDKDYEQAFEFAHEMKGTVGNFGLTPLYLKICTVVEQLRSKKHDELSREFEEILAEYSRVMGLVEP